MVDNFNLSAIRGATILVIDDGEANVLLLERLLGRAGAGRVEGLSDPRLAVQRFNECQPDIVLLDMHMPFKDGVQVLESLMRAMPHPLTAPIVMLTADNTIEARHRALAAGAKDFITKPFEQTEVLLRIQSLLETRALHQAVQRHNAELEEDLRRRTEADRIVAAERDERERRIDFVLGQEAIDMVYQPITRLSTGEVHGMEALARFHLSPERPPDQWFAEAASVGRGPDLELLALAAGVRHLDLLPGQAYLSVNLGPDTLYDERLPACIGSCLSRVVLELTEHSVVEEYDRLAEAMEPLRSAGARVAVDDAGSGYSSLRHILRLKPDIIKLDRDLTFDIDRDPARRALAAALVRFAEELDSRVIAEGIETVAQLDVLLDLGVEFGQGYLLGRPGPLTCSSRH